MNKSKLNETISKLSKEELNEIFPPIERKNFVVRKSWYGRNQVISFVNNKKQRIMPCWIKRQYWSQSTDMPSNVREIVIDRVEVK